MWGFLELVGPPERTPLFYPVRASWVKDLDPQVDLVRGVFTGPAFSSVLTCYLTFSDAQERPDY